MILRRFKLVIPIGLALASSLVLLCVWSLDNSEKSYESIIERIASAPVAEVASHIESAQAYITFQSKGVSAKPGAESARPIADLYFQLGNALLSRSEDELLDMAHEYYTKSIELYPSLHMGWPYYQMGRIYERRGEDFFGKAVIHYAIVALYNSGDLWLKSEYRMALLNQRMNKPPIQSEHLYNYLRYSSLDVNGDAAQFSENSLDDKDESLYVCACIALATGDLGRSGDLFARFLKKNPADYSAQYYLDKWVKHSLKPLYPVSGDLLSSCFAPKAFRNGELLLVHNNLIRADLFVPQLDGEGLNLSVEMDNPFQKRVQVFASLNRQTQNFIFEKDSIIKFDAWFSAPQPRNLVELHIIFEDGESVSAGPLWVRVRKLHAELSSPERQAERKL